MKKRPHTKNGTTVKLKQEKFYECDKDKKNCEHVHSLPKVIKVVDKDEIPSVISMKGKF